MPPASRNGLSVVSEAHEPLLDEEDTDMHANTTADDEAGHDNLNGLISGKNKGFGPHEELSDETAKRRNPFKIVVAIFLILVAVLCWVAEIMLTEVLHISVTCICCGSSGLQDL
jgi:hypothetical protein